MSAIWGCVDLGGGALTEGLNAAMEKPLHEYMIDRYASVYGGNIVMGCGVQYITPEAEREPLPIFDEEAGLYFTADCMVDNRAELVSELCPGADGTPDGELMFLAYKKWRDDMPKHVRGAYSYAAYDIRENRLIVGADHVFSRSVYYSRAGGRVWFSTLIEPILQGGGEKPEINEEWVTLFLSITSLATLSNPIDTPYKGISRVQASHYVVFRKDGEETVEYWSPKDVKPLRLKSEDEYKERFRSIMEQAASEVLRSPGETGIMLSGGLDSSAVASFAEPILTQKGKRLHSYTYVPVETYKSSYNDKYINTNERGLVETLCRMYPGITPKFLDVPEQNAISSIGRILPFLEVPYKSHTNLAWIEAFAGIARNDGCRIMLGGQMGNATISAGNIFTCILSCITHGRMIRAIKTASMYSIKRGISRKWTARHILHELAPGFVRRRGVKDHWGPSYINREFARGIGLTDKDARTERNIGLMKLYTFEMERSLIFNPTAMAQVGDAETKLYLKHGIIARDITRDVRMFEFCLSAPMECFAGPGGQTRRLVRNYLSDKLPAPLIDEKAPKGRQSGDALDRLKPRWDSLYAELARGCAVPQLRKYIDADMVAASLKRFETLPEPGEEKDFIRLCAVYMIGCFLEITEGKFSEPGK